MQVARRKVKRGNFAQPYSQLIFAAPEEGMSAPQLSFDPEIHEYRLNGRVLTPVTHVLETVLRTSSPWWKSAHRDRGIAVHKIAEAIDSGEYDPAANVFPASWGEEDKSQVTKRAEAYQVFKESVG